MALTRSWKSSLAFYAPEDVVRRARSAAYLSGTRTCAAGSDRRRRRPRRPHRLSRGPRTAAPRYRRPPRPATASRQVGARASSADGYGHSTGRARSRNAHATGRSPDHDRPMCFCHWPVTPTGPPPAFSATRSWTRRKSRPFWIAVKPNPQAEPHSPGASGRLPVNFAPAPRKHPCRQAAGVSRSAP